MNARVNSKPQPVEAPASWRFWLVAGFMAVLVVLLVGRLVVLQVLPVGDRDYQFLQKQGDARALRSEPLPAYRGMITDRNGLPLAVSTPVKTIQADMESLRENPDAWPALAQALGMPLDQLRTKIESGKGVDYLRRLMPPAEADKVLALRIPGVSALTEYKRYYPAGKVAAHIIGFTNVEDRGQEGIELAQENFLHGIPGAERVLRNKRGQMIRDLGLLRAAQPGRDLQLSIDLRLQYLAYREIQAAVEANRADSGSIVVLDSRTGEILAMANEPSFNPNDRSQSTPSERRNRAVIDLLEPGSTVKPLSMIAALESGQYNPHTPIDTRPGSIRLGGAEIKDHENYGLIDLTRVITKSSNVGMSKIAMSLDPALIPDALTRVGFGKPTGIGFPGEASRPLLHPKRWPDHDRAALAYGYAVAVTPLQIAQAYAVLANHGVRQPLTLIRNESVAEGHAVVAPEITAQIVEMMKTVVSDEGTAKKARVPGYTVAGKTGTAHMLGEHGGYAEHNYVSLFAGMAPASDPRIVTVIAISNPQGGQYYGGLVSAPVFSRVMGGTLRLLTVSPDDPLVARVTPVKALPDSNAQEHT